MSKTNFSLPERLKSFVDDRDRQHLRGLLLAGGTSAPMEAVDKAYFDGLRARAKRGRAE